MLTRPLRVATLAALLAAGAIHSAHAQSSVTIYGVVDVAVEISDAGRGSTARVVGAGIAPSRLGFRGSEDLGGGLSAIFKLEQGVNPDTGTLAAGGLAFGREASVGLSSSTLGTLTLGRTPMPYFQLSVAVDAFGYGHSGGLLAVTRSTATASRQVTPIMASARVDNSFHYISPSYEGVSFRLQGGLGEGSTTQGRTYGGALQYAKGPWNVIATGMQVNGANNSNRKATALMVGGDYDFGPAKLFVGYSKESNDCRTCTGAYLRVEGTAANGASDFRMINVGTRIPFGSLTLIGQVVRLQDRTEYAVTTGSRDANWLALGAEYSLSKRTRIYASAGVIDNKNGSSYVVGTSTVQQAQGAVGANDPSAKVFSTGVSVFF